MKTRLVLLGVLAVASLSACDKAPTTAGGVPGGPAAASEDKVDACALLKDEEVKPILGDFDRQPDGIWCTWENKTDYHSVTIRLGTAGTAPGDELPPVSPMYGETEAGPDGMRYAPGNVVLFAADGRACEIQVVTSVSDDSDRPTATKLVKLVRERLG